MWSNPAVFGPEKRHLIAIYSFIRQSFASSCAHKTVRSSGPTPKGLLGEAETATVYSSASDNIYLTMSNQPRSNRRKCGDGDEEAFGGPMYDEATARKMLRRRRCLTLDTKITARRR